MFKYNPMPYYRGNDLDNPIGQIKPYDHHILLRRQAGRISMKLILLILLILQFSLITALADTTALPVKVFLCAGQSNMGGAGNGAGLDAETAAQFPDKAIWYRWSDILTHNDKWDPLDAHCGFGPEKTFALEMAKAFPGNIIAIVKVQRGATPIEFWTPGESNPYNSRLGAPELARQVAAVTADLDAKKKAGEIPGWEWGGFIWMQGEGNANGGIMPPNSYLPELQKLAAWARTATATPNLPIVIGRISSQLSPSVVRASGGLRISKSKAPPNATKFLPDDADYVDDGQKRGPLCYDKQLQNVRHDQLAFCDQDIRAAWVNIDDLVLVDGYHYAASGYAEMGRRFAKVYLDLIKATP
jgi:hypothetical protein